MPWGSTFTNRLGTGASRLVWRLSRISAGYTDNPGSSVAVNSAADASESWLVEAPSISGAGVSVNGWSPQVSSCNISMAAPQPADFQTIARRLPTGTLVILDAKDPRDSTWETVFYGAVSTMSRVGPRVTIGLRSVLGALQTRIDNDEGPLFDKLVESNHLTLASPYTAGDTSVQLSASNSAFQTNGAIGAIRITPTTGDPFVLTYTSRTLALLGGVSSTAIVGTTEVNAQTGDKVEPLAYLAGHPMDIARKILVSTGTGANGAYDQYPRTWGFGLPHDAVDAADFVQARDAVSPYPAPSSYADYDIIHVVDQAQPAAFDWLASFLAVFGIWPVQRQGRISFRATTDPKNPSLPTISTSVLSINRFDVIEVAEGSPYTSLVPARVYNRSIIYDGGTVSAGFVLPYTPRFPSTTGADVDLTLYTDDSAIANDVAGRVYRWEGFPPRTYTLLCTIRCAQLCPGDWVSLNLDMVGDEQYPDLSQAPPEHRRGMVLNVDPDWRAGACRIVVGMTSAQ